MPEATRGRPRGEPRGEQRRRIVAAARAAFTARGYDGVTMSSIATDARVPRAVVYEVVGDKEHLLGAVADQVASELVEAVDERFSRPEEIDRSLEDIVGDDFRWFVELIGSEPSYAAIIRLSGRLAPEEEGPAGRGRRRIEDRLTDLHVARARAYGLERPATARVLSVAVLALLERIAIRTAQDRWPPSAVAELVAEFATGGYLRVESDGAADAFEKLAGD
jgi:AcrR family transcriptional regulator